MEDLMKGFTPWSNDLLNESQIPGIPIKLTINAINLDSGIVPLKIVDVEDSRSYETPKDIVGYIPETANPGKSGSMWLFGHLESPIRGEGSIFSRLPEIPDILRHGVPVHALVETTDASYLYWITETLTVHQDDLRIMDIEEASLVMVTCIPRLVYDYRLLVMGELIGVKNQDIE
jgi:sortase (surface protein transpeptidase)